MAKTTLETNLHSLRVQFDDRARWSRFTQFPQLPEELRLYIWKLAALSSRCRVVQLPLLSTPSTLPLLLTSKEARSESEKIYTKLRVWQRSVFVALDAIWLWKQVDPLYVKKIMNTVEGTTPPIKKLAIRLDTWLTFCNDERAWIKKSGGWWDALAKIEELAIVIGYTSSGVFYGDYPDGNGKSLTSPLVEPRKALLRFAQSTQYANLGSLGVINGERWVDIEQTGSDFLREAWQRRLEWSV